jgi:hypothetical protein
VAVLDLFVFAAAEVQNTPEQENSTNKTVTSDIQK